MVRLVSCGVREYRQAVIDGERQRHHKQEKEGRKEEKKKRRKEGLRTVYVLQLRIAACQQREQRWLGARPDLRAQVLQTLRHLHEALDSTQHRPAVGRTCKVISDVSIVPID